ncbi:MAG TPA: aminopeptidase P family protein [Alphaproteobacteria bacterium]|nr:aminopeptidase P family protein [Micavibrio sp.]MBK9561694.1 aminopeptidase P family protein [Micavibrio sp.]HQX27787.1 aminopeptidase P family protein [Alphaproteobacteria bacterium]
MKNAAEKLSGLRGQLKKQGLAGFIVPRISEYQGEFVSAYAERLAWLTGFTGSAGSALVLADKAAIITDGRYTIQLAQQADKGLYEFLNNPQTTSAKWLAENAKPDDVIGYDPWLLTVKQATEFAKTLGEKGIKFEPVNANPVDDVWKDKPSFPKEKAEIFPIEFAGVDSAAKRKSICKILQEKNLSACVITLPDSLMWLLNVRGNDVEHTPVVLSFGILHATGKTEWFVHPEKITPEVKKHLGADVEIVSPDKLESRLKALEGPVGLDFSRSPVWFKQALDNKAVDFKDPCVDPKAIKNSAEQKSLRAAHVRDGAALVNFLYWLDNNKSSLTELDVVARLEEFRRKDNSYRGPSFSTISGWAANGAIVHYRADEETNAKINPPGLLLLDSGGQYVDGTTDITRTIAIGKPTEEMKEHFTLVLKGHIAVASGKFPEGTNGVHIDALARAALLSAGLDYSHGTGHGVGCYLSVHEESASLSTRGTEAVKAGMFLSNEPGYYKEGAYGIRTESLVLVVEAGEGEDDKKLLGFETFSLVPIDRALIKKEMLTGAELSWLNAYHETVLKIIGPRLEKPVRAWLELQAAAL